MQYFCCDNFKGFFSFEGFAALVFYIRVIFEAAILSVSFRSKQALQRNRVGVEWEKTFLGSSFRRKKFEIRAARLSPDSLSEEGVQQKKCQKYGFAKDTLVLLYCLECEQQCIKRHFTNKSIHELYFAKKPANLILGNWNSKKNRLAKETLLLQRTKRKSWSRIGETFPDWGRERGCLRKGKKKERP